MLPMTIARAIIRVLESPITGLVLAVGSIWLTFYLDRKNKTVRRIAFRTASLGLRNWGTVSGRPVTALTVALWNAGTLEIRKADLTPHEPLTVRVADGSEIFAARVRTMSRPANNIAITSGPEFGAYAAKATVEFDYLNPGDGAVLEIVFAGRPYTDLLVEGALIGIGSPTRLLDTGLARVLFVFVVSELLWLIGAASWRSGAAWYASALIAMGAVLYPLYVAVHSSNKSPVPTTLETELTPPPLLEVPPTRP